VAAETTAVETATRDYFEAIAVPRLADLESHSIGELRTLARWWRILSNEFDGDGALTPAGAAISSLKVTSIAGDTATVQIHGSLEETTSYLNPGGSALIRTDISGPVTLQRGATWQVTDFHRGGGSVRQQMYPVVRGQQTRQGITVKVVGVDLRPGGTVLVLQVRNSTTLKAGAAEPVIRDARGREHPTGLRNTVVLEVARRSTATHALYFPGRLNPRTTRFRFRVDYQLGCTPECRIWTSFDIPTQLVR
jgi:hypothetical protein